MTASPSRGPCSAFVAPVGGCSFRATSTARGVSRTGCPTADGRQSLHPTRRCAPPNVVRRSAVCCKAETAPERKPEPGSAARSVRVGLISVVLFFNAMLWALVICPLMFLVAVVGTVIRRRLQAIQITLMQLWMRLTLRSSFLRVNVSNLALAPADARVLYVCNHQSALDVFVTSFLLRRTRYLMPAKAFSVPLIGWMMRLAGWVPVDGTDRRSQMKALKDASEALETSSLVVFPEGVPNAGGVLKRFPTAVFRAAKAAGVLVCPLTINGTGSMSDGKPGVPARRPTEPITLTVHRPIEASVDLKEIAQLAFVAIQSALPKRLWGS